MARIGNVVFVWKVSPTIDQTEQHKTVIKVKETIPQYETRATEKKIRGKYQESLEYRQLFEEVWFSL